MRSHTRGRASQSLTCVGTAESNLASPPASNMRDVKPADAHPDCGAKSLWLTRTEQTIVLEILSSRRSSLLKNGNCLAPSWRNVVGTRYCSVRDLSEVFSFSPKTEDAPRNFDRRSHPCDDRFCDLAIAISTNHTGDIAGVRVHRDVRIHGLGGIRPSAVRTATPTAIPAIVQLGIRWNDLPKDGFDLVRPHSADDSPAVLTTACLSEPEIADAAGSLPANRRRRSSALVGHRNHIAISGRRHAARAISNRRTLFDRSRRIAHLSNDAPQIRQNSPATTFQEESNAKRAFIDF